MALYNRRPSTPARQFSSPRCFRKNPLSGLITALILALVTIISGSSLLAQDGTENQDAATLRALNGTLLRLQDELQHAGPRLVPTLRSQVSTVLNKRAFVLQRMVRLNPEEAVSFALSPELRADLSATFPDAAPLLETQGTIRGVVEVSVEDSADLKHSKTHVRLKSSSNQSLELKFPKGKRTPQSGETVAVTGVISGAYMAVSTMQSSYTTSSTTSGTTASNCPQTGDQKTAVLLVSIPNGPVPGGVSVSSLEDVYFAKNSAGPSLDGFLREASYGKASASGDVLGPYFLNGTYTSCSDVGGVMLNDAVAAAIGAGVNLANYTRLSLVFPDIWGCGWSGFAQVNACSLQTSSGTFNLSLSEISAAYTAPRMAGVELVSHEIGHNLGLLHSGRIQPALGTDAIGPLTSPGSEDDLDDWWSVMGSNDSGLYPSPQKSETLGWMAPTTNFQVVQSGGTFTLQPLEVNSTGLQAIKVQRGTGNNEWLWLEYRQPTGSYDSGLLPQPFTGALIHYQDANTQPGHSYLANFTPSDTSWMSPALAAGRTWKDPYSNLSISVLSATSTGLTVSVSYGAVACTPANPTVSMTPSNPSTYAGSAANYDITVTNNDSASCATGTFMPSSIQPSGWTVAFSANSINLAPGQSGTLTMTQTPPAGTVPGTYAVAATESDLSNSSTATGNLTVVSAQPISASLSASASSYTKKNALGLTATVTKSGTPVSGAAVTFTMTMADGTVVTQSSTTGRKGTASWSYRFGQQSPSGNYSAVAKASYNAQTTTTNTVTFSVR